MGTRSTIGIRRLDGTVTKIYCHWDGYIEGNGMLLQLCYDTPEKIEALLKLGNLSSLNEYIEPKGHHTFERPERNVCVAYHRDRGEEFATIPYNQTEEFNYMFDENLGAWLVTQYQWKEVESDYVNARHEYNKPMTSFLIDELMREHECVVKNWEDDEFATKENLIETLLEKARVQVVLANKRKADEYDAWYRAYCD